MRAATSFGGGWGIWGVRALPLVHCWSTLTGGKASLALHVIVHRQSDLFEIVRTLRLVGPLHAQTERLARAAQ